VSLTETQKVAVRRHLGVPFAGTAQAGRLFGWRFTWYREDLEYRLNNMAPSEEQLLTGNALSSFRLAGRPAVGDVLTYMITPASGNLVTATYTVQESDFALPANQVNPSESSPLYAIALNSALAVNNAAGQFGYAGVGVMPADLFSPQYLSPYYSELQIASSSVEPFTIAASVVGTTNIVVVNSGTVCPVQITINSAAGSQTLYGLIAFCDYLANQMASANLSLQFQKADVTTFRPDEVRARYAQYKLYCEQLEEALGGENYVRSIGGKGGGGGAVA
jgi:hypothetical protein